MPGNTLLCSLVTLWYANANVIPPGRQNISCTWWNDKLTVLLLPKSSQHPSKGQTSQASNLNGKATEQDKASSSYGLDFDKNLLSVPAQHSCSVMKDSTAACSEGGWFQWWSSWLAKVTTQKVGGDYLLNKNSLCWLSSWRIGPLSDERTSLWPGEPLFQTSNVCWCLIFNYKDHSSRLVPFIRQPIRKISQTPPPPETLRTSLTQRSSARPTALLLDGEVQAAVSKHAWTKEPKQTDDGQQDFVEWK